MSTDGDQKRSKEEGGTGGEERRAQRVDDRAALLVVAAFTTSIVGALILAVVYVVGGQAQWEGIALALSLGGIGFGIAVWARYFMTDEEVIEERHALASTEEEVAAFAEAFEAGGQTLARRGLLAKLALGALGALGLAALFPIRSLGPRPGQGLKGTAYGGAGRPLRLVNAEGAPIRPTELSRTGLVTAWPEGHEHDADAPTLLLQVDIERFRPLPGREDWVVGDVVAYSKLCTHTGCPVGLYQTELDLLLCPCHQSTFDVLHGAEPVFGPAARPLPQLPLDVDEEGFLIATGDFSDPVAGGFWDRGRT
ncbi:MAG: Rieske 2Fe-2S domain-containing protein [Actinomycetota bacterium]|jgi:ubiquinol-cytochrome c reductase iron-sulfur subunit|nr:Rieske 2Fe-2S domain-containing protein [Actinomycetota bacterium]